MANQGSGRGRFVESHDAVGCAGCDDVLVSESIYAALGGDAGVLRLADAWHQRCLQDPVASHPFSHGVHPQHVERLAAYWSEALGGPRSYSDKIGDHSSVLRIHAGCGEHEELDRCALACFTAALDDAHVSDDPQLRSVLTDWFAQMIAAMAAYPRSAADVPDDVPFPIWSRAGTVS